MVLTPSSIKEWVVGGSGIVGDALLAWLVLPTRGHARNIQNNRIMRQLAIKTGATDVLIRACDHTTTREKDHDGTWYWYRTDRHQTVFCRINGVWMQGDVFIVKGKERQWSIMPDRQRKDYAIGGKGVQLWECTTEKNPSALSGGEILDFVKSTGRVPWLYVNRSKKPSGSSTEASTEASTEHHNEQTGTGSSGASVSCEHWGNEKGGWEDIRVDDNEEWWKVNADEVEEHTSGEATSAQSEVEDSTKSGGMQAGNIILDHFAFSQAALFMRPGGSIRPDRIVVTFGALPHEEGGETVGTAGGQLSINTIVASNQVSGVGANQHAIPISMSSSLNAANTPFRVNNTSAQLASLSVTTIVSPYYNASWGLGMNRASNSGAQT